MLLDEGNEALEVAHGDGRALALKEVEILVENVDKQGHLGAHAVVGDLERTLQAGKYALLVAEGGRDVVSGPEKVRALEDGAALVLLGDELGGMLSGLGGEAVVVLGGEAGGL